MRVPLSWLRQFIAIDKTPIEMAKILTLLGLEVEAIEQMEPSFEGVVVGRVISSEKHPNADSLQLASVFDGKDTYQVVCGAPNCRAGIKVAFARIGATLSDEEGKPFKIKKAKLRGVESSGMLCSGAELKLSDDGNGIIELDDSLVEGSDFAAICREVVLEVGLTPNLGHCACILGIARELSASTGVPIQTPSVKIKEESSLPIQQQAKVEIIDQENCTRYATRVIKGVKIAPSPQWLQRRLELSGLRPINNVVDVTNYVLLEYGHPLHAFDYDKLAGHSIIVRSASEGEKFTTLDGKERSLSKGMLVISDEKEAVAIAGVMGGQNKEVTNDSVNILLESAYFNPRSVRRTSKKLGLQTDASRRFERGVDPNNVLLALDRAADLIQQLAGGAVAQGVIDIKLSDFAEKVIVCRVNRVSELLGVSLSAGEIESIFHRLGFKTKTERDRIHVTIPTYRNDITAEIDLVEEVARLYGYNNISTNETRFESSNLASAPIFLFERETRNRLIAEGLQEFLTCDLIGPKLFSYIGENFFPENNLVKVLNPVSVEQSILRPSMLPGLLELVKYNFDHQNHDVMGFEIGRIHFKESEEQFKEQSVVGIIMTGKSDPHHWDIKPSDVDFYDLKGVVENVMHEFGIEHLHFDPSKLKIFHSGRQATIKSGNVVVGSMGEVHPAITRRLDVPQRIYYAEFNLHDLIPLRVPTQKMIPIPVYPGSERDWTITLKEETTNNEVFNVLEQIDSPILEEVSLLDIYRSDRLGKERKNVTLRFIYRDPQKTVSQEEVDAEHAKVTQQALRFLGKEVI
jgi:phenylalanyl-tRNA synthetase beta chain